MHAAQSAATTAKDAVDRKQSELRELHAKEQQLQRQVTHHEEKMRRLAQQTAVKRQALDGKLSKLRGDWEEIGVEREGLTEQLRRNDVATSETKHKVGR